MKLRFAPETGRPGEDSSSDRALAIVEGTANCTGDDLEIDLEVHFRRLPVKRGITQIVIYSIGCTAAQVELSVDGAEVVDLPEPEGLAVQYETTTTSGSTTELKAAPSIKGEGPAIKAEFAIGEASRSRTRSTADKATFADKEYRVVPAPSADKRSGQWTIDLLRGTKAVRDFMLGRTRLGSKWSNKDAFRGAVAVSNDVRFFDDKGRPLDAWRSWLMLAACWRRGIRLKGLAGRRQNFGFEP
jgi:hypothetical protein